MFAKKLAGCLAATAFITTPAIATADGVNEPVKVKNIKQKKSKLDHSVYFEFDSSQLSEAAKAELDQLVEWMMDNPNRKVTLIGHTDDVGTPDYNDDLGKRRAKSVKAYLTNQGVSSVRVKTYTEGEATQVSEVDYLNRKATPYVNPKRNGNDDEYANVWLITTEEEDRGAKADLTADYETNTEVDADAYAAADRFDEDDDEDERADHLLTPAGMSVSVGAGVSDFTDSDTRGITDTGGMWEARLAVGTRTPIAIEAAYIGTVNDIDALGIDDEAVLLGSGIEGNVRVNVVQTLGVQPYLFGGIGWTHYNVVNEEFDVAGLDQDEDMMHFPVGAGIGFRYAGALIDLRGTYRFATQDDLIENSQFNADEVDLDTWSATGRIGWEF